MDKLQRAKDKLPMYLMFALFKNGDNAHLCLGE
jgi:hypothetical protein